mgnify:CR=1 FL=1
MSLKHILSRKSIKGETVAAPEALLSLAVTALGIMRKKIKLKSNIKTCYQKNNKRLFTKTKHTGPYQKMFGRQSI